MVFNILGLNHVWCTDPDPHDAGRLNLPPSPRPKDKRMARRAVDKRQPLNKNPLRQRQAVAVCDILPEIVTRKNKKKVDSMNRTTLVVNGRSIIDHSELSQDNLK